MFGFGALAAFGLAQNPALIESIEGRICGATEVYVGVITAVDFDREQITLQISETFRGPKLTTLTIGQKDSEHWSSMREPLRAAKTPILLDNGLGKWRWLPLDSEAESMFQLNLKQAKKPGGLLQNVRDWVTKFPNPTNSTSLRLPYRMAARAGVLTTHNVLIVPICPEIERAGRDILKKPKSYLIETRDESAPSLEEDLAKLRIVAITILSHFKSEDNAKLLRSLLDDPFLGPFKWHQEIFPVRHAAERALARWTQ